MDVLDAIHERRAYRSLAPVEISECLIRDLAESVRMAPSCFNNQPWRFVFVSDPAVLEDMHLALSEGNGWARSASLIIAVFSRKEDDCIIRDRLYHQFDTGMGVGFLLLRATELGLVAHPIAGFSPKKTHEVLKIPDTYDVITLIIVGKHSSDLSPVLNDKQVAAEKQRPQRMPWDAFVHLDRFRKENGKTIGR